MLEPETKLRVMVDANVLFSGMLWPRWPYEVLQHGIRGDFKLVLTPFVIEQVRRTVSSRFTSEIGRFDEFLGQLDFEEASDPALAEVEQHKNLVRGIELADSVTIDPHKWLAMPFSAGVVLTRRPEARRDSRPVGDRSGEFLGRSGGGAEARQRPGSLHGA